MGAMNMGIQFDPRPGPLWCGYGRRVPRWEPWLVLAGCVALVVLGWLWGR